MAINVRTSNTEVLNKPAFKDVLAAQTETKESELGAFVRANFPELHSLVESSFSRSSLSNSQYAKGSLEILKKYNECVAKVISGSKFLKKCLGRHRLDKVLEQAHNGTLKIDIPASELPAFERGIGELKALKAELDNFMNLQVGNIVSHLKELSHEDRLKCHKQIISAFMTLPGYEKCFNHKDERAEFAIEFSNKIATALVRSEVNDILDGVDRNHNFIRLNQQIGKLAEAVESLFCVDHDLSITLVAEFLKEAIEARSGSFKTYCSNQQHLLGHVSDQDLRESIAETEKKYQNLMQLLVEKRDDVCNSAINKDADKTLEMANKTLKRLRNAEKKLLKTLASVESRQTALEAKSKSLKQKRQDIRIIPAFTKAEAEQKKAKLAKVETEIASVTKKEEVLAKKRIEIRANINATVEKIDRTLGEIKAINHGKDNNFDGAEFKGLRDKANDALQEDRKLREDESNLQYQNRRNFRVFTHFLQGVDVKVAPVDQRHAVAKRAEVLTDETANYFGLVGKIKGFFNYCLGYDKVTTISTEELAKVLHTPPNVVEAAHRNLTDRQKNHYYREMTKILGVRPTFLKA